MQDYATPETAVKLKEAGFPQPTSFTYGQIWYDRSNSDKIAMGVLSEKAAMWLKLNKK